MPFLTRKLTPVEVLDEEGLSLIEANAEVLLERVGIEVGNFPEALEIFRDGGCEVTETRVRFPAGLARSSHGNRANDLHPARPQPRA